MAIANNTQQSDLLERLGAMFGYGDSGTTGQYMTVPTALNTSEGWAPPNTAGTAAATSGSGLGLNVGTGQLALQGLGSLAGIWSSMNQNKLAKDQFNFQKDFANTNLNNSIKSYNTSLEDRLNSRGAVEGRSAEFTNDLVNQRRLSR